MYIDGFKMEEHFAHNMCVILLVQEADGDGSSLEQIRRKLSQIKGGN